MQIIFDFVLKFSSYALFRSFSSIQHRLTNAIEMILIVFLIDKLNCLHSRFWQFLTINIRIFFLQMQI